MSCRSYFIQCFKGHQGQYLNLKENKMVMLIHLCRVLPLNFESLYFPHSGISRQGMPLQYIRTKEIFNSFIFQLYVNFKTVFLRTHLNIFSCFLFSLNVEDCMYVYKCLGSDFRVWLNPETMSCFFLWFLHFSLCWYFFHIQLDIIQNQNYCTTHYIFFLLDLKY